MGFKILSFGQKFISQPLIWLYRTRAPPELMLCYLCYFDFFQYEIADRLCWHACIFKPAYWAAINFGPNHMAWPLYLMTMHRTVNELSNLNQFLELLFWQCLDGATHGPLGSMGEICKFKQLMCTVPNSLFY